jgi:radical SAM superfamily enzyme YgiQ (UPF0313 family)
VRVLLVSTYDMGRQPFGLASPAAWLRRAGIDVTCADLAKQTLDDAAVREADAIAFFLPMHTATRLALPVIDRVRALNPDARVIAYGLYAPLNASLLRERGVSHVLGGEFEEDLVRRVRGDAGAVEATGTPRLNFIVPAREGLPPLSRYASLHIAGERRIAGYTEASRGCKHRCRHCPIVPVYDGRFRVVAPDVVLDDVRAQVAAGARHVTFGDPDFFNGIRHADTIMRGLARDFPELTYDVTIKIEHLLEHRAMLPVLRETGCVLVTSAVESIDDGVLEKFQKGHTRRDFERAVVLCRDEGIALAPTFVPFTPWTTPRSYLELLHEIDRLDLVDHVASVQLAIRLLIPQGSRMLELEDIRAVTGSFSAGSLTYPWRHPDPRVDLLQAELTRIVGATPGAPRREIFARVWDVAHDCAGAVCPRRDGAAAPRATVPYLNEPWYC